MIRGAGQVLVAVGPQADQDAAASLDLRDVVEGLLVDVILDRDRHDRHLLVDQRDRPVLHLARRIALGVDVADLFELERALERHWEIVPAAEVQEVRRIFEQVGDMLDL